MGAQEQNQWGTIILPGPPSKYFLIFGRKYLDLRIVKTMLKKKKKTKKTPQIIRLFKMTIFRDEQ